MCIFDELNDIVGHKQEFVNFISQTTMCTLNHLTFAALFNSKAHRHVRTFFINQLMFPSFWDIGTLLLNTLQVESLIEIVLILEPCISSVFPFVVPLSNIGTFITKLILLKLYSSSKAHEMQSFIENHNDIMRRFILACHTYNVGLDDILFDILQITIQSKPAVFFPAKIIDDKLFFCNISNIFYVWKYLIRKMDLKGLAKYLLDSFFLNSAFPSVLFDVAQVIPAIHPCFFNLMQLIISSIYQRDVASVLSFTWDTIETENKDNYSSLPSVLTLLLLYLQSSSGMKDIVIVLLNFANIFKSSYLLEQNVEMDFRIQLIRSLDGYSSTESTHNRIANIYRKSEHTTGISLCQNNLLLTTKECEIGVMWLQNYILGGLEEIQGDFAVFVSQYPSQSIFWSILSLLISLPVTLADESSTHMAISRIRKLFGEADECNMYTHMMVTPIDNDAILGISHFIDNILIILQNKGLFSERLINKSIGCIGTYAVRPVLLSLLLSKNVLQLFLNFVKENYCRANASLALQFMLEKQTVDTPICRQAILSV